MHSGAALLERTLGAVDRQTRKPESIVAVDAGSDDGSFQLLSESRLGQVVTAAHPLTFGRAVDAAVQILPPSTSDNDWLWLLGHDNAPQPGALEALLAAVEIAPSVSIAGPKLMRVTHPDVMIGFGETVTRLGRTARLVDGELDQGQRDNTNDVLGVAAAGMLVRRSVWVTLKGFDPGLPSADAALDFSVRARLAGHRVVVVPAAKVASAGGPELFDTPKISDRGRARVIRSAQLHRRLVWAPPLAVPVHWISLVPLAIIRSLLQLVTKRPGRVGSELAAAFSTAFSGLSVLRARRSMRRTRRAGWAAVLPLRLTPARARELRALRSDSELDDRGDPAPYVERVGFLAGGGPWAMVATGIVGVVAFWRLLGESSVIGGSLLPLDASVATLWTHVGYGWRDINLGFSGAADPFAGVLALLGSVTFWQPSFSLVLLYLFALPIAALGAWFCARRFSRRPRLPFLAALVWGLAPPLLASLDGGHLGAVIAHLLLPWLVLLAVDGARSWAAAAGAALLFAVVTASAPILAPALLVMWISWVAWHPRDAARLLGIPLPAAVLFAPLVVDQIVRGTPLGLLADPGVPFGAPTAVSGVQLGLGAASGGSNGWSQFLDLIALPGTVGPVVAAAFVLPLGVLALVALFVRGSSRAIPCLAVSLLGFVTAVVAVHLGVSSIGTATVGIWPGSALSLFWLGLGGSAVVALSNIGRAAVASAAVLGLTSVLVIVPLIAVPFMTQDGLGTRTVTAGPERILPAFVDAEAATRPTIGTLVLYPEGRAALRATIERGRGTTLDDQSTLEATAATLTPAGDRLATLAGNLASRSGYDLRPDLDEFAVGFVVLQKSSRGADAAALTDAERDAFARAQQALDGNALLVSVGQTPDGFLWRYTGSDDNRYAQGPSNTGTTLGLWILVAQGLVIGLTVLLAVPTGRRRRLRPQRSGAGRSTPAVEDSDD